MKTWEPGQISFGGFPRSGNHSLGFILTNAFSDRNVIWLRHRITDLSTAPNCAVVIRNPLESVSSWIECNYDERPDAVDRILDWYVRYMNGVLDCQERLAIFKLEDVSKNPYGCSIAFSTKFDLEKPKEVKAPQVEEWLTQNMPTHFISDISISKERWYNAVQSNQLYEKAVSLYNKAYLITELI